MADEEDDWLPTELLWPIEDDVIDELEPMELVIELEPVDPTEVEPLEPAGGSTATPGDDAPDGPPSRCCCM